MDNQNGLKTAFRTLASKNRLAKHYIKKKLAQDAGEHWVTVNAGSKEGGEGGGSHVLLDGEGRVVAGMGGKFKGQNIDRIERKKFINQNAWNRQRKALTEKAGSEASKRISQTAVSSIMTPESSTEQDRSVAQSHLAELLKRSKADTSGQGLINRLHTGIETEQAELKAKQEAPKAEEQPKLNTKIDHSSVINDIADRVRDQYNQNGRLFDARTELRKQLSNLKDGTYVTYSKDIILLKKGDELLFNSKRFGWTASGTPTDFFFDGNKLKLGIGDTPEEAKANYKETEVIDEAKGATVRKENAEKEQARKQAEKAEREERSKDFYLNKIDKIKDRISNGENYSAGLYKSELYKSLLAKANHGNTEEVNRVLNELKKEGIYTDKHRIWGLADVAKKNADYITERHEKADKTTTALKGATVNKEVYNGEARTSVKFDNIPNYATRVALKQNGFKWNADAGEWYKSEGENGTAHESIVNALKDQGFNEQPKTDAPTGQQTEEQPRDMKNAFSDKYQKIDNSNLNKYQKVDNISNNKNIENGVTNMNTNQESQATPKTDATASMSIKDYEGKANINPRVATYLEDMGMKLSKAQYDKIATDYPPGDRSGSASALVGRDMRALQAFKKDYAKDINRTIADHEAAFEDVEGYHDFKGGSITISKKGDYLGNTQHASISFAGKPSEETRALLKKNGFTYNPRYKTWENTARLGANKHEKLLQALKDGVTIESTQQATPTAQPSQAQPTQQAEGKQYHGTGIENKNGRYEVSFNEFPSYKLRTDMKANGFRWDPNAKVWHTTDREKLDQVMSKHFTERT